MSNIDYETIDERRYRSDRSERSHHHRDRRDEQPRYFETQETYVRAPAAPESPYAVRGVTTDVIRRPVREDSDLSIEEVRRDFPPPAAGAYVQQRTMIRDDRYGPPARTRSAERGLQYGGVYGENPRRSYNDLDDRHSRKSGLYVEQEVKKEGRRRSLSRNEKIITAVAGAALAVGGKELWDRRQADGRPVTRNPLQTAALGAAGAFAGYEGAELYNHKFAKGGEEKVKTYIAHRGKDGEMAEAYYSEDEEVEKPKKSRRKSIVDQALALTGLGAAAKAVGGSSRSRRGSDESRDTRARSRGGRSDRDKSPEGAAKYQQAAKAALLAGAAEAFRVRNEPGGLAGNGKRILTAAIGATAIDAARDKDPDKHSKRHILEAVVGGLATNYAVNGSRKDIEDEDGKSARGSRSRSRSRSKGPGGSGAGPLAALATAGLGAFAAKKLTDRSRSRSRAGDSRRRRDSRDSYDSRSPSPRGDGKDRHKRSKSVTDYARKGLAALGIGGAAGAAAADHNGRDRDVEYEETHIRKSHRSDRDRSRSRGLDDGYGSRRSRDVGYADTRGDPYDDSRYADSRASDIGSRRSARAKDGNKNRRIAEGKQAPSDTDSDLGSSTDDEKRIKKMKGKQILTAGLATVATIHAAHNVYQSMEKRNARHKAVQEGKMSPEEARKLKAKATLQDAASIGIAALGIKGAYSEIKEANEMRHECKEFREKKEERHNKRIERLKKTPKSSESRRRASGYDSAPPDSRRYDDPVPPHYVDGNPYAYSTTALPPPPVGYYDDRR